MGEKPIFVLHGRIVTMLEEENIIDNGYLAIKDGRIVAIEREFTALPAEFSGVEIVRTGSTIYPGLIDLHNHFVYNVLPLWVVPKRYDNRSQWPAHAEYKSGVSKPIKQALAKYTESAKALVRYVEAKALISGTTTGQGMRTKVNGGSQLFQGALRFVEEPGSTGLPPARSLVPDLIVTGSTACERIASFRSALTDGNGGVYFYHLSEGIDDSSRKHFSNLVSHDLINDKLVGIHALGLHSDDLKHLAEKKAKIVWSPFSNQLLYGKTLDLHALKSSGIQFSIGCDWSPSGSKNLLQELKVAWFASTAQGTVFSNYELVQAVTSNAAAVTGWNEYMGNLAIGKLADIVIIKDVAEDSYLHLIKAREQDVELVVINGEPRCGRNEFMKALYKHKPGDLEETTIGDQKKALYLYTEGSKINDLGFGEAVALLTDIMNDLPGFVSKMEQKALLMGIGSEGAEEFSVELDNEFEIESDVFQEYEHSDMAEFFADPPMADRVEFDTATVAGDEYWARIDAQKNISQGLKDWLSRCYK